MTYFHRAGNVIFLEHQILSPVSMGFVLLSVEFSMSFFLPRHFQSTFYFCLNIPFVSFGSFFQYHTVIFLYICGFNFLKFVVNVFSTKIGRVVVIFCVSCYHFIKIIFLKIILDIFKNKKSAFPNLFLENIMS